MPWGVVTIFSDASKSGRPERLSDAVWPLLTGAGLAPAGSAGLSAVLGDAAGIVRGIWSAAGTLRVPAAAVWAVCVTPSGSAEAAAATDDGWAAWISAMSPAFGVSLFLSPDFGRTAGATGICKPSADTALAPCADCESRCAKIASSVGTPRAAAGAVPARSAALVETAGAGLAGRAATRIEPANIRRCRSKGRTTTNRMIFCGFDSKPCASRRGLRRGMNCSPGKSCRRFATAETGKSADFPAKFWHSACEPFSGRKAFPGLLRP